MTTFRERMVGAVGPVDGQRWTVAPRGSALLDDVVLAAATTAGSRRDTLDLAALSVRVLGLDPDRDGYLAQIDGGRVTGIAPAPLDVDCGFADLLTRGTVGRRMHYRLLVAHRSRWFVVEGLKVTRGGPLTTWTATTTLHTVVVQLDEDLALHPDRSTVIRAGGMPGAVVCSGVLRVRGLVRQGLSMRQDVPSFLTGFLRRALSP